MVNLLMKQEGQTSLCWPLITRKLDSVDVGKGLNRIPLHFGGQALPCGVCESTIDIVKLPCWKEKNASLNAIVISFIHFNCRMSR